MRQRRDFWGNSRVDTVYQAKQSGNTLQGRVHRAGGGLVMPIPISTALRGTLETPEVSRVRWVKKMRIHGVSTTWQATLPNGVLTDTPQRLMSVMAHNLPLM